MPNIKINNQEVMFSVDTDRYDNVILRFISYGDMNRHEFVKKILSILKHKIGNDVSFDSDNKGAGLAFKIPDHLLTKLFIDIIRN